jgi:transposase InsO family protein
VALIHTMDASFCVGALEEALTPFGRPDIFSADPGSQFTSAVFAGTLAAAGIRISIDGRGRWMDNGSSNGCGARSNTRTSISKAMPTAARPRPAPPTPGAWQPHANVGFGAMASMAPRL